MSNYFVLPVPQQNSQPPTPTTPPVGLVAATTQKLDEKQSTTQQPTSSINDLKLDVELLSQKIDSLIESDV